MMSTAVALMAVFFSCVAARGTEAEPGATIDADLCIYGGTSGGVVAAAQAARLGLSVVIVEPGRHLGGMMASGLSWTDVGDASRIRAVSGMAREVYERIGAHYGQKPGSTFEVPPLDGQQKLGVDFEKPPALAFEPKVAEAVFEAMVREASVRILRGSVLKSVRKEGTRLCELRTYDGRLIRARMFIDATYEGDLLGRAGVSYTIGREANAKYDETFNGIQGPATRATAGKFTIHVDPYLIRGQPASGLLPYLLCDEALGVVGAGDNRVQSYNYRVCLTDDPANRIPLSAPKDYDATNYELLARWIEARLAAKEKLTLRSFVKYDPLQNRKFDFNNRWALSTDYIGGAHAYPESDIVGRARIAQAHEDYLRGLFYFLATDERVPANVRMEMARFGLCKDEFTDNGGWPHQLYVREARRMVSDFVMTEQHCRGLLVAPHSIGLGAYGTDMHAVRRIVINGQPVNEGTNGVAVPKPYPIGYGIIVPRKSECENLFVTFAVSASHVAFGSIRMEAVFMTLSQSAALAACLALEKGGVVQEVDYALLRHRLLNAGIVLDW